MRENTEVQYLNYRGSTENGGKLRYCPRKRDFFSGKTKITENKIQLQSKPTLLNVP